MSTLARAVLFAAFMFVTSAAATAAQPTFGSLSSGQVIGGFRTAALYLNDADKPIGARFIHRKSGFTLDVLQIQTVPRGFIWVTTYPTSDMGEPHTQEHLLLGKGDKGRAVASREPMALADSSAFTEQWRTCYSYYTTAGAEVFFDQTERRLDALLHPDYTDEEVRREVRNFGITGIAGEQSLRLEEKGTVYNEMVSSMDRAIYRIYRTANTMVYGPGHPLSWNSGGSPEALRVMQPSDIRAFHRQNYHLANMGLIASLPKDVALGAALASIQALLERVEPRRAGQPVRTARDLPAPRPAPAGEIRYVDYPHRNAQQPGSVWLAWPAERRLRTADKQLLELFLQNVAGDATTNLYKRFVDSKTREIELGASSVFSEVSDDPGQPLIVGFNDVPVARMNDTAMDDLRTRVLDELARIAGLPDGSPELAAFNARMKSRLIEMRRGLSKFVNSPPTFGFRHGGSEWLNQLAELNKSPGFRKSLTFKPELAAIERRLQGNRNIWGPLLAQWKITGVQPWMLAARPNAALIDQAQAEREQRVQAETAKLQAKYGAAEAQDAIRRYRAEYDVQTAVIDRATAAAVPPRFVDKPPLTLDDQLDYKVVRAAGGVPLVASTFDSMSSATTGIALRLDGVPEDQLVYVAALPALLTRVGVVENGRPVSYEEMSERLKKEILSLNAGFSTNAATGRVELVFRGAGNDPAEAKRAMGWIALALLHADWRPENLARIRDVVDQALSSLRQTMQHSEESWVQAVATVYWRQNHPLLMTTESFMTQTHNMLRLSWMLKDGDDEERAAASAFLAELGSVKGSRDELRALLTELKDGKSTRQERLSGTVRALAIDAARDLDATLAEIPDASLAADWNYLCLRLSRDLLAGPKAALGAFEGLRRQLARTGNARMFTIGSPATQQTLRPGVDALIGKLDPSPQTKVVYRNVSLVRERLRQRDPSAVNPLFVGLLNPNAQGGVFLNSAPLAGYEDTDPDKLLDYLATNLYGGRGAHGIFMKTWAAGLAYSNGIRVRPASGRLSYYAERTPELPQTLRFVIDEVRRAGKPDPALVEYAIAESFTATRAASDYEARGEAMAADLADGLTPEVVASFRKSLLGLRQTRDLQETLQQRVLRAYGMVLPGLGAKAAQVPDSVYFVIGPEKQFAAWETYLKTVEGPDARVHRLYPRDFWMP
ncbi:MAG: hypothetical protein ABI831_04530 [Betaproteobacteria bacterium]